MAMKHMKLNKHVCKHKKINMPIKHKTHQIFLSLFAKQNNMHKTKIRSPPFCQKQKINKGVKSNQPIKRYMRYTFMKRKTLS